MSTIVTQSPVVQIQWEDSAHPVGRWVHLDIDELHNSDPVRCLSVGWEVYRDNRVTVLAPNVGEIQNCDDEQASGLIRISARCIIARLILVPPEDDE